MSRGPICANATNKVWIYQITGKKALVTGSTAGIGLAIAEALAAEGASVIVNGRTAARVDAALREQLARQKSAGESSRVWPPILRNR